MKTKMKDIVVILPGITGSYLAKDGKEIWGVSGSAVLRALRTLGDSLGDLELNGDDPNLDMLDDQITATRIAPATHLVPGLWKVVDGYSDLVRMLNNSFSLIEGNLDDEAPANFYQFPYDWRRDNRVAARQLKRLIDRQLPVWRDRSGHSDAKVILIGHSMGGLVSRYYTEVLDGWPHVKALVTFGTPYRGSLNALDYLSNGYKKMFVDLTEVLRSCTSIYQLLPIYPLISVGGGPDLCRVAEMEGLSQVDQARAIGALKFHREIEEALERNRKEPEYSVSVLPVVGVAQPTLQSATIDGRHLRVSKELPDGMDPSLSGGDGTVPRISSIPIEMSDQVFEVGFSQMHGSLQATDHALVVVREWLKRLQLSSSLKPIRGPGDIIEDIHLPEVSVALEDVYSSKDNILITMSCCDRRSEKSVTSMRIRVSDCDTYEQVFDTTVDVSAEKVEVVLPELQEGQYELRVAPQKSTVNNFVVRDVFCVD
ncbi:MAG: lecithin--cholesterol acyltransferase [Pseudomonadota bacterium]